MKERENKIMMNNNFLRMINEDFVNYNENMNLLPKVRDNLRDEIVNVVEEFGWETYGGDGVNAILDEWWENKGRPMTEMFGCHPNYVKGKFMIVLQDTSYLRGINVSDASRFCEYVKNVLYDRYIDKYMEVKNDINPQDVTDDIYMCTRNNRWGYYKLLKEDYKVVQDVSNIFNIINREIYDGLITETMENKIKELNNTFHIHKGMKATRYIGKMCRELKIDEDSDYNSRFTAFCDAYSPKRMKRTTVLSWNPVDYLRMSMGNSWASCHTIDVNDNDSGYGGMYCGGTESYMLDGTSLIFYTVDSDYNGTEYELQPKIERCMFHIDPEKNFFIQSRMYPQCNDSASGIYKSVREVVQKIVAESWNIDNYWILSKGTSKCCNLIISKGVHYRDYQYFEEANVSYNKSVPDVKAKAKKITVGHSGICITCGKIHNNSDSIACKEHSQHNTCYECGCYISEDEMYYCESTGEYYCGDCVTYCDCCEEYYPNDQITEVDGYGYVCEGCIEYSDNFVRCDYCGKIIFIDSCDMIRTQDGNYYCDTSCAEYDYYRYVESEDEYYHIDDVEYCDECCCWVLNDEYDDEYGMCVECAKNLNNDLDKAV